MMIGKNTYDLEIAEPKSYTADSLLNLSPREREVCHWVYEGKRDREIAMILGISHRTVTAHVCSILKKLGVENRTCAALVWSRMASQEEISVPPPASW